MTKPAAFKQADITRALRGAAAAGMKPSGYRVNAVTGDIEVQLGANDTASTNSFDAIRGRG